eukprot:GHVR01021594.1.p1 GENE.GHVR01021594.1~~GHVR01021594.1.p1  ORF type:complete len:303 (-),score=13.23 GHVR01021594.1:266-1174(-)
MFLSLASVVLTKCRVHTPHLFQTYTASHIPVSPASLLFDRPQPVGPNGICTCAWTFLHLRNLVCYFGKNGLIQCTTDTRGSMLLSSCGSVTHSRLDMWCALTPETKSEIGFLFLRRDACGRRVKVLRPFEGVGGLEDQLSFKMLSSRSSDVNYTHKPCLSISEISEDPRTSKISLKSKRKFTSIQQAYFNLTNVHNIKDKEFEAEDEHSAFVIQAKKARAAHLALIQAKLDEELLQNLRSTGFAPDTGSVPDGGKRDSNNIISRYSHTSNEIIKQEPHKQAVGSKRNSLLSQGSSRSLQESA